MGHDSGMNPSELWALWGAIPLVRLRARVNGRPSGLDMVALTRKVQGWMWRNTCASADAPCADPGASGRCKHAQDGCAANRAFPLNLVTGKTYQMASVFLRWNQAAAAIDVLALGEPDEALHPALGHALFTALGGKHAPVEPQLVTVASSFPLREGVVGFETVTPWSAGAADRHHPAPRTALELNQFFHYRLLASLAHRGYKLTALALAMGAAGTLPTPEQSKATCLAALALGRRVLATDCELVQAELRSTTVVSLPSASGRWRTGGQPRAVYLPITGRFTLRATRDAWPWLALMQLCGSGENADEGWGALDCLAPSVG